MDLDYLDSLYERGDAERARTRTAPVQPEYDPTPDMSGIVGRPDKPSSEEKAAVKKQQAVVAKADWRTVTDEQIDEYIKRVCVSSLHLTSSCSMSLSPEDGVVDQRLRVHGIRNLRIADASVFPKIPSAHTMAPTVMVAERCAEFLRTEWQERKGK